MLFFFKLVFLSYQNILNWNFKFPQAMMAWTWIQSYNSFNETCPYKCRQQQYDDFKVHAVRTLCKMLTHVKNVRITKVAPFEQDWPWGDRARSELQGPCTFDGLLICFPFWHRMSYKRVITILHFINTSGKNNLKFIIQLCSFLLKL